MAGEVVVDEILQETFTKAYESIKRLEWKGKDSFFRWLCGTAKHVLLNAADKIRRYEPREDFHGVPAKAVSPSKTLRREERLDRLQRSLDDLPADYRKVVQLARIEGLKIKEIAKRMNRSPDAIKHVLARALIQLRSNFGDTESLHLPDRGLQTGETSRGSSPEGEPE